MKGLLLKDFYVLWKTCWSYLILIAGFSFIIFGSGNAIYGAYTSLLMGMLPMTVQALDEKERWVQYSGTLPYTKKQLVSVKFVLGIILVLAQSVLMSAAAVANSVLVKEAGLAVLPYLPMYLSIYILVGAFASICMPFVFRLGAEKGRLIYMFFAVLVGVLSAVFAVAATDPDSALSAGSLGKAPVIIPAGILALAVLIYAATWTISVAMYKKREI